MQFRDDVNLTGIFNLVEELTETQSASSGSYTEKKITRDINGALDEYMFISIRSSGTWEIDDTAHTDYPIITTSIVSSQQDYSFTDDENGNQIWDIYRVEAKDSNGTWQLLIPYDEYSEKTSLSEQSTETGTPTRYSKTANGIFLDRTPNYNSTSGLKIYFSRSGSYFTSSDTTKTPGIPNTFHKFLAWLPSYWYWLPKDSNKAQLFKIEVDRQIKEIETYHSNRTKDEKPSLKVRQESNR